MIDDLTTEFRRSLMTFGQKTRYRVPTEQQRRAVKDIVGCMAGACGSGARRGNKNALKQGCIRVKPWRSADSCETCCVNRVCYCNR